MSSLANKFNKKKKLVAHGKHKKKAPIPSNIIMVNEIEKSKKNADTFIEESKLPVLEIDSLTYSVMTKETCQKLSVCEIKNPNKTDPTSSVEDPRLGTIENNILCSTCEKTNEDCPGHPGIINLPTNIIHPFFKQYAVQVLKSICVYCCKLLMTEKVIKEKGFFSHAGYSRLKAISDESKNFTCRSPKCGVNYTFKSTKASFSEFLVVPYIIKKGKVEQDGHLSADRIKQIFNCISEKDAFLMGFNKNHPKNFIVDFIPVMPISARPYNYMENERKDNYLTIKYGEIISKIIEAEQYDLPAQKEEIYEAISIFYGDLIKISESSKNNSRVGNADSIKSINELLSGKTGYLKCHIMGKRCDYTGRTPLGPNRSLNFGYVAPPNEFKNITMMEKVTTYNLEDLRNYSQEGNIIFLCPSKGKLAGRKLKFDISKHTLNVGDTVHRKIRNGDSILFNRQPTLHRQGMLGYVCDFQDKFSIGVHLSSTSGHNADFDGDEGNVHVLQDTAANLEAKFVMSSINCIMSFTNSSPQASLVYNSITGAFLLTREEVMFTKKEFEEGLNSIYKYAKNDYVKNNYATLEQRIKNTSVKMYSGRGLFSVLFPPDFYYTRSKSGDVKVKIDNGILQRGQLKKSDVGGSPNSIVQCLWKWHGKQVTANYITAANFLLNWYLEKSGMSVGIKDCMVKKRDRTFFKEEKEKILKKLEEEVLALPIADESSSKIDQENYKNKLVSKLEKSKKEIKILFFPDNPSKESLLENDNSLKIMLESKGSEAKATEMIGLCGQVFIGQNIPQKTLSGKKRWVTTYDIKDNRPESRGFCKNGYFDGLDPDEYFAQAQSGREGLIGTAVMTKHSGSLYKKILKAQEDLIINYDGSVRNQVGIIYQFCYANGFSTQDSVKDSTEDNDTIYSFFNSKDLCGRINSESGFDNSNLKDIIVDSVKSINKKYGVKEEEIESEEEVDDDEAFSAYVDQEMEIDD